MLKHVTGDLIALAEQGEFDIIVHGCNCFNTMGGGIAAQIARQYPEAAWVDKRTTKGDINKLATYTSVDTGKFMIVNAYTQFDMSYDGKKDVFEYDSFAVICRKLEHIGGNLRYGFPYIGMGLARGDKGHITAILEVFARGVAKQGGSCTLVEYG